MRPADPRFIKTPETENQGPARGTDSKFRRAAKFLILIGAEEAARILPHLEPEQIESISREIASVRGIDPEEGKAILEEFKALLSSSYRFLGTSSGGPESARRILYAAFGPEKGEALLEKALPFSGERLFAFLEDFKPEQIGLLLREESPAVTALILSRLSPKLSAEILASRKDRAELARRIAKGGQISPEVLGQVAEALKKKTLALGPQGTETLEINGAKTLAEILRHGDYSLGDKILQDLEERDPALGKDLRDEMLSLDDAAGMDDRVLQEKLRTMGDRDIALLLKGRSRDFSGKLLSNVSAERRLRIQEEGELMGPVPRRDAEEAARSFLDWLWKEGPQVLRTTKDVYL
ncbi:MAG: flagellar motor switch protein FliG [Treponema sp.]|jgi:flagellar motor switch protein FliG|nr:flagellar motor switch protein FliG [Treponema sp.]